MSIFGDLNEDPTPIDPSGVRAPGPSEDLEGKGTAEAAGTQRVWEVERMEGPRDEPELGTQEVERGKGTDYIGGTPPPVIPPIHLHGGRRYTDHPGDPIGEQRLDSPSDPRRSGYMPYRSVGGGTWFLLMVLVLALVGAAAYGYLVLHSNHIRVTQVPRMLGSITTLGGRMDATEAKLRGLAANTDGVASRLAVLDGKVDSGLRAARGQTREMVGQATSHLQAEMDQRGDAVDTRLRGIESAQKHDQAQLAQLNEELQQQVASLQAQLTSAQQSTGRDLANVQEQTRNNQADLQTLQQNLHRNKMTFELVKDSPTELAPGVTLTILKTDVSYQRFNGYISLTNEGKTMWLKNLSAQEPVDLYSRQFNHPYSLVVTAVNADGVAGYLLLPAGA
ncbi:MAG: hypothetical protein ACLQVG_18050 [Terriglobia bacterium]